MTTHPTTRIDEIRNQSIDKMISPLIESPPDATLSKILGLLKDRVAYQVFVPESNRCGMISERDILKETNLDTAKASVLTKYVPTLEKGSLVGEAARLMSDYRIRAVPVSEQRKIIGQVNCSRVLEEIRGKMERGLRISALATKTPQPIEEETPQSKARDLLVRRRIDHLPVTQGKRVSGLVTSTQIISLLGGTQRIGSKSILPQTKGSLDFPARDLMDANPLTYSPDATAERALEQLLDSAKTCVLITQWEELQGIATQRDFMTLLAAPEPEPDFPVFMIGLPEDPFESEATKAKFKRTVHQLHKVYPDIIEARSVIKAKHKSGAERERYEVSVQIRTPRDSYSYKAEGWELPVIYDLITDRLKRLMTKKLKPRRHRERESPELP